jgi:LysR family glycine cleavage system transcriptional activator
MPQRPPALRTLAAFEAAARSQSFAKAAAELHLTPGAVSHAIRSLEERLGDRLFERKGRGVVLTRYGQAFAARVRLGLSLITDAFGANLRSSSKRLVVSTLPSIASKVLLPALETLRTIVPDIALDIRLSEDLEQFHEGDVDLAVRFGPGSWAGLGSQQIATETLFPVCSPGLREKLKLERPLDLLACPLIDHPSSSWKLWFDPVDLDFGSVAPWLMIDDAATVIDAACLGHGVALARGKLARRDIDQGRIVRLFEREVNAEYGYFCVVGHTGLRSPVSAVFTEWLALEMAGSRHPKNDRV